MRHPEVITSTSVPNLFGEELDHVVLAEQNPCVGKELLEEFPFLKVFIHDERPDLPRLGIRLDECLNGILHVVHVLSFHERVENVLALRTSNTA
jgi:hypothetical protein